MKNTIDALIAAFKTLWTPKMLFMLLLPMLIASALWVGAALFFWGSWVASISGWVQAMPLEQWMAQGFLAIVSHYVISIILMLLLLPAIYVTALAITAVFAMPVMVKYVAQKNYPELALKHGGSTAGSIVNAMVAIVVYCAGWLLSLPLWLFSPLALMIPVILMAYLNQRLFRYDALAEHASREEYDLIIRRASFKLYLLGAMTGLLQFVPLLNLMAPVFIALAFIHLCLSELQQLRQENQTAANQAHFNIAAL